MLLHIPKVLSAEAVSRCRVMLTSANWGDGRATAGSQSATVKRNLQLPEGAPGVRDAQHLIIDALNGNGIFLSGAMPKSTWLALSWRAVQILIALSFR